MAAVATEGGWLERPAYVVGGAVVSHGALHDRAARWASLLSGEGIGPGRRVLVALPDGVALVGAFLATLRLGGVAVLSNPRLHPDELAVQARECEPEVVVCEPSLAGRFPECRVVPVDLLEAEAGGAPAAPAQPVDPGAPAYAQWSSGTTGKPKAALHRHGDALVYHRAFALGAISLGPDDVVLSVSKMHFAYGLGNSLFFPLLSGCRAVLEPGPPRPEVVAELVEHHRVSVLFAVPTFYAHLGQVRPERLRSLRVAVSAGEVLTPALAERTRRLLGCPVLDGLGSTEVGQTFLSNTLAAARDGTVGRPLPPYRVAVRDEDGRPLPAGRMGTLWVAGPTVLLGYLGRPGGTAAVRDGEWLCTGDRAVVDDDGFVSLRGRVDDLEMVGGITVAPVEIEEVLSACSGVVEVAVAAVRDGAGASHLEAFAVPAPGAGPRLADAVVELARARLTPYKVPRVVHLVDSLPRTSTGKLRRFVLRSGTWTGGQQAG